MERKREIMRPGTQVRGRERERGREGGRKEGEMEMDRWNRKQRN